MIATTPATTAGLLAMLDLFWARQRDFFTDEIKTNPAGLFEVVRVIVGRRA